MRLRNKKDVCSTAIFRNNGSVPLHEKAAAPIVDHNIELPELAVGVRQVTAPLRSGARSG